MFEDSLIESTNRSKTRRGTATAISFAIQAGIVAVLVLLPLIFVQALPTARLATELVAPPPPPPPPPPAAASAAPAHPQPVKSVPTLTAELRTPTRIPKQVSTAPESASASASAVPAPGGVIGGVPGGVAGGQIGGTIGGVLNAVPAAVPNLQRVRVSQGVSQGLLVHKVEPKYPNLARQAHVQGTVQLHALVGKDGKVETVQVMSGQPMLASAAVQAVREWKYKPYLLNGKPVEIDTDITVNFTLNG